jgi:hypothetical protein
MEQFVRNACLMHCPEPHHRFSCTIEKWTPVWSFTHPHLLAATTTKDAFTTLALDHTGSSWRPGRPHMHREHHLRCPEPWLFCQRSEARPGEWRARPSGHGSWHRHAHTGGSRCHTGAALSSPCCLWPPAGERSGADSWQPAHAPSRSATLDTLLNTGTLEFWNTGPAPVPLGSPFTPAQFAQYNPAGKAPFTGNDLDDSQVSIGTATTGRPSVLFEMKGSAIQSFGSFTQQNTGNYLTLTLDRKAIESAVIQSAITGQGEITGNFTLQHAAALVSVLKYPSLPVALHIASESSF